MRQRQLAWGLALVVLGMVAFGAWFWSERRAVERAASVFLAALIAGDAETLIAQLDGPALEAYAAKTPQEQTEFTQPIPQGQAEIREVHIHASSARVRVLWKVSGFDIWSDLELTKTASGPWKVTGIREPKMVPSWEQVQKKMKAEPQPGSPVETLGAKFQGRDDVEIHPLTETQLDQ